MDGWNNWKKGREQGKKKSRAKFSSPTLLLYPFKTQLSTEHNNVAFSSDDASSIFLTAYSHILYHLEFI